MGFTFLSKSLKCVNHNNNNGINMLKRFIFLICIFCLPFSLQAGYQPNPWYFDLGCETFKIYRDKSNDHIDLFRYNPETRNYDWFQNLSNNAQKFDYHMEGLDLHFISVTHESGHMLVYKWKNGSFYVWG
jgi:hypothetical protein